MCRDFIENSKLVNNGKSSSRCDMCVHQDNRRDCKINGTDNRTALVHGHDHRGSNVRMVFR